MNHLCDLHSREEKSNFTWRYLGVIILKKHKV